MMTTKDDGGPAFPVVAANGLGHVADGMTLRDWFAGQVLPSIIAATSSGVHDPGATRNMPEEASIEACLAADAFAIADAMIEARKK